VHILHVVASHGWGGMERAVVEVASELASRCRVSVLLPRGASYEHRFADEVTLHSLPEGSRRNPITVWRLARRIRDIAPDLVHAHATKASEMVWWASHLPGGLGGAPFIATKQNTRRSRIFDHVRHVTGVSETVAATVRDPDRVHVVYNGVRVRGVEPQEKSDVFTMLSITRLDPYKRVDVLVRAMVDLEFPARLLIAGEGSERGRLEDLVRELGLQDRVEFLGLREDIPELLSAAHVQVAASTREGFSLGIVEGLQYADVVLTTPVGGAREIFPERFLVGTKGRSGHTPASARSRRDAAHAGVDPGAFAEAITRVHDDYGAYVEAFAEVKDRHRARFTWKAITDAYEAVYASVLAGRG
jgi:glycosyltransferase involved in cell wall biosynthesis